MAGSQVTRWAPLAQEAQRKFGVPADVLLALIQTESSGLEGQVSSANAQGLTQFIPSTARSYGVDVRPGHARSQIFGTAKYLLALGFKKNPAGALASYAGGPGNPQSSYASLILDRAKGYRQFGASATAQPAAPSAPRAPAQASTPAASDYQSARGNLIASFLYGGTDRFTQGTRAQGLESRDPLQFALNLRALRAAEPAATPNPPASASQPASGGARPASGADLGGKSPLFELFWQGAGGVDIKNGQKVPQGFVSGHTDHVHVAAGPKTVVGLGRIAQEKFGLHVGENPHFGGVHPVHVKNSYHYKGEAIDVSGDPAKMRAYAHYVAGVYGVR